MKVIKLKIHNYSTISIYTVLDDVANEFLNNKYKVMKTIPITDIEVENVATEFIDSRNAMLIMQGKENTINFDINSNSVFITIKDT